MAAAVKNSVIVPAFNEEEGLPLVLRGIFSVVDDTFEVIVVDDSSTDRTREVAREFPCRLICRDGERGKGRALRAGIADALGENVMWIDADATYPVEILPQMAAVLATHDMVVCSRMGGRENIPIVNRIGNAILTKLTQRLYGFKACDPCSGAYGAKKRHLQNMALSSNGFEIEAEIALKSASMGLRTVELFLDYGPRVGKSKLSGLRDGSIILRTIIGSLVLHNPTLLFTVPGSLLLITGIGLIIWYLAKPMPMLDKPQEFVIMVAAVLASLIGLQLAVFGIVTQLYASVHRFASPGRLTRFLLGNRGRRFIIIAGTVGACVGLGLVLAVIPYEIPHGTVSFTNLYENNKLAIPGLVAGLFGLETLLLAIFVSIFRPKEQ